MNSNQKNFRPTQHEISDVTAESRRDARRGTLAGGIGGYLAGALLKKKAAKIAGAVAGGVAGHMIGSRVGRREGAKDVVKSRQALLQNMSARLDSLEERELARLGFETVDGATAAKPVSGIPNRLPRRPSVRGQRSEPGNGRSSEAEFFSPTRQAIADKWGYGIAEALDDDELDDEHAAALHDAVMAEIQRTDSPAAGVKRGEDFERNVLATHLGAKAVDAMSPAEVHCHFLSAQRRGLIEFDGADETTDLAILTRERTDTGQFAPEGQTDSLAVQRAYARSPRERRTGVSVATGAAGVAAGLAGAYAHLRGKKRRAPRLTAGSPPALPGAIGADFAARDDVSHPVRDTLAGVGAGALGVAGLLALRKRRLARLASGVPKLPPRTIDVDSQTLSRRLPFLTQLAMGHPGSYVIRRRTLRGKKPPTGIHPRQLGKAKKHSLAFLIQDDDFPLVPQQPQKLPPGVKRRVPLARTRKEVLARLKAMTQLSRRDFGAGSLAAGLADGAIDALAVGGATNPAKKKKLLIDANGNVINPQFLPDPGTTSTSSFASAIDRLHELGFGSAATSAILRDAGVIAGADLTAEELHDAITKAQKRKKQKALLKGGIEATPGMNGAPTTMSSVHSTLTEFDADGARDRARKRAGELGAAGVGGIAGAVGGLKYDQGSPVAHSDLKPGDRVYRRFGPGGLFQHAGVVGEDGKITHRTRGSATYRAIKPDSFAKTGKAPTYRDQDQSNRED